MRDRNSIGKHQTALPKKSHVAAQHLVRLPQAQNAVVSMQCAGRACRERGREDLAGAIQPRVSTNVVYCHQLRFEHLLVAPLGQALGLAPAPGLRPLLSYMTQKADFLCCPSNDRAMTPTTVRHTAWNRLCASQAFWKKASRLHVT